MSHYNVFTITSHTSSELLTMKSLCQCRESLSSSIERKTLVDFQFNCELARFLPQFNRSTTHVDHEKKKRSSWKIRIIPNCLSSCCFRMEEFVHWKLECERMTSMMRKIECKQARWSGTDSLLPESSQITSRSDIQKSLISHLAELSLSLLYFFFFREGSAPAYCRCEPEILGEIRFSCNLDMSLETNQRRAYSKSLRMKIWTFLLFHDKSIKNWAVKKIIVVRPLALSLDEDLTQFFGVLFCVLEKNTRQSTLSVAAGFTSCSLSYPLSRTLVFHRENEIIVSKEGKKRKKFRVECCRQWQQRERTRKT